MGISDSELSSYEEKQRLADITSDDHVDNASTKSSHILKMKHWRIWKNVLIVSSGFMFLFTAFNALQNLQSSIHQDEHIGVVSLSVIYCSFVISCLFLPAILIDRIGCKYTLVLSCCGYLTYTAAHFYPKWWTLMPSAVVLGCTAASLWSAQGTYISTSALQYAQLTQQEAQTVITKFFGVFHMILFTNQIWGNLISSFVLKSADASANSTMNVTATGSCGAHFCPSNSLASITPASSSTVRMLTMVYTACGAVAVLLILLFVDKLSAKKERKKLSDLCRATFNNMQNKKALLLIPFAMFTGIDVGFLAADFTKSYVTCVLGIEKVGLIMICNGVTMAISSSCVAKLSEFIGRLTVLIITALVHGVVLALLLTYVTSIDAGPAIYAYFAVSGVWGLCDGVWQTMLRVLFGVSFPSDNAAAFSTMNVWQSFGFAAAFGYSGYLCTNVKIYIVIALLILTCISLVALERELKRTGDETVDEELPALKKGEDIVMNDYSMRSGSFREGPV